MGLQPPGCNPKNWCPLRESDPRPLPYQGSALPLSQMGDIYKTKPQKHQMQTLERETGIEPASLAWKARVLPLNYSRTTTQPLDRTAPQLGQSLAFASALHITFKRSAKSKFAGGEGWIRTSVLVRGQIYSLLPLTTRPPLRRTSEYSTVTLAGRSQPWQIMLSLAPSARQTGTGWLGPACFAPSPRFSHEIKYLPTPSGAVPLPPRTRLAEVTAADEGDRRTQGGERRWVVRRQ